MITIGGYTLNPNMVWTDRDSWSSVIQSTKRTLGGKVVVTSSQAVGGRPITLSTLPDQGWLTKAQRDNLVQMSTIAGAIFTLVIDSDTFTVMFRHEDAPAVSLNPIIARTNLDTTDYFLGTIKLIQI